MAGGNPTVIVFSIVTFIKSYYTHLGEECQSATGIVLVALKPLLCIQAIESFVVTGHVDPLAEAGHARHAASGNPFRGGHGCRVYHFDS